MVCEEHGTYLPLLKVNDACLASHVSSCEPLCVGGGGGGRGVRFFLIFFFFWGGGGGGGSFSFIFLTVDKFLKLTSEFSCFA